MRNIVFGFLTLVAVWCAIALQASGQECAPANSAAGAKSFNKSFIPHAAPATDPAEPFRALPVTPSNSSQRELATDATAEELDFLANGPRLYSMDKALAISERTGKPVVCWVGPHIFANEKARKASAELGDTTIQAVMTTDGESTDRDGKRLPALRVKFSTSNYAAASKTAYIPVAKLNADSPAKILAYVRGAERGR